ncbi:GNAT family N-acetyltransferase [Streptomyces sp. NPDC026672]|uniref:GNAT family N-acetyltransferase n=1 Tax=unclassified Streptomyces TaxID=2593676 RepID=UPI00340EF7C3
MEISAAGRLEVRITAADVGKRVSVRRLREAVGPGEKFTDTVGVLTSWDDGVLLITRKDGESVRIAESSLVAGKVVPPAPARRRGPAADYEELARISARAWRPVESERLGEWELRAAGGFTRRANSVLPLGDPGLPLDAALEAVRRWYGVRGLPAYVQTATGGEGTQESLCAELERRGWTREVSAEVWTGALAPLADRAEGTGVTLSRETNTAWLAAYERKDLTGTALRVLTSGPSVWFARIPVTATGTPGTDAATAAQDASATATQDVPATATQDVPATATQDVPATATQDVPATATQDVPATATRDVPVGGAQDLAAPTTRDVPVGGADLPAAPRGVPAAIGRMVVDGRWAGFAAVAVGDAFRRRGLATEVMAALARRALEEGASAAWLQVESDNVGARALYTRLGLAPHHVYHHYRAPDAPGAGR